MSAVKHTPGPWTAREGTTTGMEVVATKPRGGIYTVARCGGKDREANAHLIAAADDMLAALRAMDEADNLQAISDALLLGRAAIAKAEGRTDA